MPIYAPSRERSPKDLRASLFHLVRDFEADPLGNRKLVRDMLDNDRQEFRAIATEMVRDLPDSRGVQCLVATLVANGLLLQALCDPALDKKQAILLGHAAVRVDPMVDAALARSLADSETGQGSVLVQDPARLMDTICEIGDPSHMMASMMRLLRHSNPLVRAKAVKVVGRGSKSAKWVRQRLNEDDPRIRANAIEALWSVDTEEARTVLHYACADTNNRAAANAMMGLYFLGDSSVLAELARMAGHESALFRSSAAWAMGEMGDQRFLQALRPMINETDPIVRKRAFVALGRIKNAHHALSSAAATCHVAARLLPAEGPESTRRLLVAVTDEEGRDQAKIPPLGFILSEGASYVTSYHVTEKPVHEAMSLVFVIPRSREAGGAFHDGVESCLRWKRTSDLWCILPYIEKAAGGEPAAGETFEPPPFTANPEALREQLGEPANRMECAGLWETVARATKVDAGSSRGKRHIIILCSGAESGAATPELMAAIQSARLPMHAIAPRSNTHLEEFCASAPAGLQVCAEEQIADSVRQAYLLCLARYEVSYQATAGDAPSLKVRVHAPGASGETVLTYPLKAE